MPKPLPRFELCPGYVTSLTDWQTHYINGPQLQQLYGLRYADCIHRHFQLSGTRKASPYPIQLHPRADGHYVQPPEAALDSWIDSAFYKLELQTRAAFSTTVKCMWARHDSRMTLPSVQAEAWGGQV